MNRNSKSHFSATDNRINIGRSRFDRTSWWKGTMSTGSLVPFYLDEVLPGDTFDMKTSVLCRMSTPIFPVMDNAYLDTYFFFVPNRLVYDHWAQLMGENDVNAWVSDVDYEVPYFHMTAHLPSENSESSAYTLADYFGLPIYNSPDLVEPGSEKSSKLSLLPLRAYQLIWNEWFRDQNLQDPVLIDRGDSSFPFLDAVSSDEINRLTAAFRPLNTVRKVNKFKDYFTSCLPAPQKGNAVLIPGFDGSVPIVTSSRQGVFGVHAPLTVRNVNGNTPSSLFQLGVDPGAGAVGYSSSSSIGSLTGVYPSNLFVGTSSGVTIDALRAAFQVQKLLWRDGNGGSRYTEIIRSHFGVVSPDARLQRPEYLGGKRIPITVNQVIQQSATDEVSPQGNTAAVSKTVDSFNGFQKSFTEHGLILGLCCLRTDHTYQNGINRLWSRSDRLDFYFPEFAHLGESPVLNKEIYFDYSDPDGVFGYQEAWAEYKMRPSYVTGAFRSGAADSLDVWHYADDYDGLPHLDASWIQESPDNVNRTLAVPGSDANQNQWLLDFYFDLKTTRPMPVYSVPGLVDHF